MFNLDQSIVLACVAICPIIALITGILFLPDGYEQLPNRRWLMRLPGYRFCYARSVRDGDWHERSVRTTLIWLGCFYLSVLGFLAPFANKFLGMTVWLLSLPVYQELLVLFFNACLCGLGYSLFGAARGLRVTLNIPSRAWLAIAGLSLLLGFADTFAMSQEVRLVVLLACKTTLLGLLGCLFFGSMLFALNETEAESAGGELGRRLVNVYLFLLMIGSLMSVVVCA
jgi:hypothetical protein